LHNFSIIAVISNKNLIFIDNLNISEEEEEETLTNPLITMEESVAAIREGFVAVIQEAQPKVSISKPEATA